jgi:uncharacterized protein YjbI with pentapeptide repeats
MDNQEILSIQYFLSAYSSGQRHFENLHLDEDKGNIKDQVLHNCVFEKCFMFLDLQNADLTNSKFINCNLKTASFKNSILTNTLFKNCAVESVAFKGAKVLNLIFEENYCYGSTIGQKDFEEHFKDAE